MGEVEDKKMPRDRLDKLSIRRALLSRRLQSSSQEREEASEKIRSHLLQWSTFQKAKVVHIYLNQPHEVHTTDIIQYCWKMKKTVVIPYLLPQPGMLGHSLFSDFNQLEIGKFDLLVPLPETRKSVDLNTIDLVIVPGVAFDQTGGRLGHGKGYYDRFLSQIQAVFLGIAFHFQLVPTLPQFSHDIPMDAVLTERGFWINTGKN